MNADEFYGGATGVSPVGHCGRTRVPRLSMSEFHLALRAQQFA